MIEHRHVAERETGHGYASLPSHDAPPAPVRAGSRAAGRESPPRGTPPPSGVARAEGNPERRMNSIKRILIVDDSPTERHVLNDMLTRAGFEVVASDNGEDAIVKARQVKPDLILMDVVMPGLNGFQATRAISRDPETRGIPIIMCTSKSQETDKIWGMRQGARDYVVKPVRRDELLAKIATLD